MRAKYSINLRDGSRVFRTPATDELTALYAWIPDEVAHKIDIGELDAMDVVNAIMKKRMEKGDFDWAKFQAERKKLNIREQPIDLSELEESKAAEAIPDNPEDSVSLEELSATASAEAPAEQEAPPMPSEQQMPPTDEGTKSAPKGGKKATKKSAKAEQSAEAPAEQEAPPMPSDDGVEGVDA